MHKHDFVGCAKYLHTRDISNLKNIYAWFFCGGGTENLWGHVPPPPPRPPVATPLFTNCANNCSCIFSKTRSPLKFYSRDFEIIRMLLIFYQVY